MWGRQYGGADNRSQCDGLPLFPKDDGPMRAAGDSLTALCESSFDLNVRQVSEGVSE